MKQTFTLHSSFSDFFAKNVPLTEATFSASTNNVASPWVHRNLMAYAAALFVTKTKHCGINSFLLN